MAIQLSLGLAPAVTVPERFQAKLPYVQRIMGGGARIDGRLHKPRQRGLTKAWFHVPRYSPGDKIVVFQL